MTIKIMDEALANKIAAGEVVERPRSIVKELVENALDAGATEIKVALTQAGIQKIIVRDNGAGMSEADAKLAFIRHATSKIFDENDLFAIHTLGFRGEALAAIAAVSKVQVVTGLVGEPATELVLEAGVVVSETKGDSTVGTRLEVSNLFYNTPARLKHLKSVQTEYAHSLEYLQKMALGRPDIRFELTHDNKLVFKTYGTGQLSETLAMIYGDKVADYLFPVEASDSDFTVRGMITHPQMQRAHNRVINLTINGRSIRHFGINHAILRGYGRLLPKGMFPIVALDISLDVKLVDVNVHPTKLEVRISEEQGLQKLIEQMIKDTLVRQNLIYRDVSRPQQIKSSDQLVLGTLNSEVKHNQKDNPQRRALATNPVKKREQDKEANGDGRSTNEVSTRQLRKKEQAVVEHIYQIPNIRAQHPLQEETMTIGKQPLASDSIQVNHLAKAGDEGQINEIVNEVVTTETHEIDAFASARQELQRLDIIGQFDATYILGQTDNTLFVIDQHAAQERIRYDEHMQQIRTKQRVVSQNLLFPFTLFLDVKEMQIVNEHKHELGRFGLDFEAFSDQEIRINAVPAWIMQESIEEYVRKTIECVVQNEKVDEAVIREKKLIMLSCRYSIKAHDVLSKDEMVRLVEQLSKTQTPFTCPHGRPTVIKQKLYEVEKWFKRV